MKIVQGDPFDAPRRLDPPPALLQPGEQLPAQRQLADIGAMFIVLRIDVHQHIVDLLMPLQQADSNRFPDLVPLGDADVRLYQDVHIHQRVRPHPASPQGVETLHAIHLLDGPADGRELLFLQAGIHQLPHAMPGQIPADPGDDQRHPCGGDGVHVGESGHGATDTDDDDQRGDCVGPAVPGVGSQHGRTQAVGHPLGVVEDPLFGQHRDHRHHQCEQPRLHQLLRVEQPLDGIPGDARGDQHQGDTQCHRGDGLETAVTVWMAFVGGAAGVLGGVQHHEIGGQVGERVDPVRDQRLRLRQEPDHQFEHRQQEIDDRADQGHLANLAVAAPFRNLLWPGAHRTPSSPTWIRIRSSPRSSLSSNTR